MLRFAVAMSLLLSVNQLVVAQNSIRVLTSNDDNCLTFTSAMERADGSRLLPLAGWVVGFFSGVAQETGIDFLRNADTEELMTKVYATCKKQPNKSVSLASEEIANALSFPKITSVRIRAVRHETNAK